MDFFWYLCCIILWRGDLHKIIQLPSSVHVIPYLVTYIRIGVISLAFLAPSLNTSLFMSISAEGRCHLSVSLSADLIAEAVTSHEEPNH